jgi:hypothetical protein
VVEVEFLVVSHFCPYHKAYLDKMMNISMHPFLTWIYVLLTHVHKGVKRLTINKRMKNGKSTILLPIAFVPTLHIITKWHLFMVCSAGVSNCSGCLLVVA